MKHMRRAERKLASALEAIRRMRRQLARALALGDKARGDLALRILRAKAEAARLHEELDRRRPAVA